VTVGYSSEQAFPLKTLQDSVHRHREPRDLSHAHVVTSETAMSDAQRDESPTEWVRSVGVGLLRRFSIPWWPTARSQRYCAMSPPPPALASATGPKSKFPLMETASWGTLKGNFGD
jgi:hypothetical protein